MSDDPTTPEEPVVWAVVGLVVIAFGLAEWSLPGGETASAPLPDSFGSGIHGVRHLYGLTPTDIALVADTLASRDAGEEAPRYVVAGYPGPQRLNGPLLTRSTADRQMARAGAEALEGRAVGGGWRQLTVAGRKRPQRRPLLSGAEVSIVSEGKRRPCPRLELERFACAPPDWSHVRRREVKVAGADVSCIWSHPLEGKRIVVDFGAVDARKGDGYRLRTALHDRVAGEPGPVDVDIRIGDRRIEHRHRAEKGWQTAPPLSIDGAAPLSVAISAERVGRRHFCFDIE